MKTVKRYLLVPADMSKPVRIVDDSAIDRDDEDQSLRFVQSLVGGNIELVPMLGTTIRAYCHEDGHRAGLKFNRRFSDWFDKLPKEVTRGYNHRIVGDVLIFGGCDPHGNARSVPQSVIDAFL